jgi:[ribosomal protein S5]-alanine N-acetyltransferase
VVCSVKLGKSLLRFCNQLLIYNMIVFETERLRVRQYELGDEESFFLLNGDEDVVRYIRPAKSRDECDLFLREVIDAYKADPLYGRWAAEDKNDQSFVGSFALIPVEGKQQMQLGYALLPQFWGKGFATELTHGGLNYVFRKTAIDPIFAYTQPPNIPSQKVLLKAGFKLLGNVREGEKEVTGFILSKEQWECR